jgi:hypothetical protein
MTLRYLNIFIALLTLVACTQSPVPPAPTMTEGHIVGNGGDHLETTFDLGRVQAKRILQRLSREDTARLHSRFGNLPIADLELLKTNAGRIIAAIETARHDWNHRPAECPVTKCACTTSSHPNTVFLSYEHCRGARIREAGSDLFHEAAHEVLKADETTAQRLTSLGYKLWSLWGHQDGPHFAPFGRPDEPLSQYSSSKYHETLVEGDQLFLMGYQHFARYDLGVGVWQTHEIVDNPDRLIDYSDYSIHWAKDHLVKGHVVTFFNCYNSYPRGSGNEFFPEEKRWKLLPRQGAPSSRYKPVQVVTPHGLFVFGGEQCYSDYPSPGLSEPIGNDIPIIDGAFYSPGQGWRKVSDPPPNPRWVPSQAVWTGKEVIVWSGTGDIRALAYDPKTDRWRALAANSPQPSLRGGAAVSWVRNQLVVYGGTAFDEKTKTITQQNLTNGALYNPQTDRWEKLSSGEGPLIRDPNTAAATPDRFFVFQDGFYEFNLTTRLWDNFTPATFINLFAPQVFVTSYEIIVAEEGRMVLFYP